MKIFIVSGPGGAGKTTLLKRLFQKKTIKKYFLQAVSCTTRPKRREEKEGKDYFFLDKDVFLALKRKNFFLETQKVLSDYYGTPKAFLLQAKKEKKGLVLCIDVKGASFLKRNLKKEKVVGIFILPPQVKALKERMRKRSGGNQKQIKERIQLAQEELRKIGLYEYIVVNDKIEEAVKYLEAIFLAEKIRRH